MVKGNKDRFVLELGNDENGQPKTLSAEETLRQMKKGYNNGYFYLEYPFLWQEMKSEEEDEFTHLVLLNKTNNAIVKISTQPCLANNVEELKELVETDLKSKECDIQQSGMENFDNLKKKKYEIKPKPKLRLLVFNMSSQVTSKLL